MWLDPSRTVFSRGEHLTSYTVIWLRWADGVVLKQPYMTKNLVSSRMWMLDMSYTICETICRLRMHVLNFLITVLLFQDGFFHKFCLWGGVIYEQWYYHPKTLTPLSWEGLIQPILFLNIWDTDRKRFLTIHKFLSTHHSVSSRIS